MDTIERARQTLRDAESTLRHLMEQGIKSQQYGDVAQIAGLADGITKLLRGSGYHTRQPSDESTTSRRGTTPEPIKKSTRPSASRRRKYPHFHRDGDLLVKIGWSKKNRSEYEHRAPWSAVVAFVEHLKNNVKGDENFTMERLLPIQDLVNGDEIPAYQAYLTLAWLRESAVVKKEGRDGYTTCAMETISSCTERSWQELNPR